MDIVQIVVILAIVGIVLWGVTSAPVIDDTYKKFIRIVVIVVTAIWLLLQLAPVLRSALG